jgi:hypothetical protein
LVPLMPPGVQVCIASLVPETTITTTVVGTTFDNATIVEREQRGLFGGEWEGRWNTTTTLME